MHTQEQRTKAVMLFIETGFNHAAVKSALGYPSRWSLDRWYADYLDKGCVKEKREHWEKFSDEEKAAAVAKCFEPDRHLSNTVKELGCPGRSLLAQWADELGTMEGANAHVGAARLKGQGRSWSRRGPRSPHPEKLNSHRTCRAKPTRPHSRMQSKAHRQGEAHASACEANKPSGHNPPARRMGSAPYAARAT